MLGYFIFSTQPCKEKKNEPCPKLLPQHPLAKVKCKLGTRSLWSWFFKKLFNRPLVVTDIDRQKVICSGLGACQYKLWNAFLPLQGHVELFILSILVHLSTVYPIWHELFSTFCECVIKYILNIGNFINIESVAWVKAFFSSFLTLIFLP